MISTDLIRRARDGLPHERQQLVRLLGTRISRVAAYYARRSDVQAEELEQEAWLGLFEALAEVDPSIGQPEQYLLRKARWKLLDALRRERIRRHTALDRLQRRRARKARCERAGRVLSRA